MNNPALERLIAQLGLTLERDLPMRSLTTVGIGGPARRLVRVSEAETLVALLQLLAELDEPYLLLGGGSNLLVADEGVPQLVVRVATGALTNEGGTVRVSAGVSLQRLVDFCASQSLAGLERLTGIPGSVGGAIYGNAGAYGQTISDHLVSVSAHDGRQVVQIDRAACRFQYRHSAFKENGFTVLAATLRLESGEAEQLKLRSAEVLRQRLQKYPRGLRCSGSFFKNVLFVEMPPAAQALVPGDKVFYGKVPAGYLLEMVGAKGRQRGEIVVAETNANLFMNRGEGAAADLWQLAREQALLVKDRYGIALEPEVQFVNLPPLGL